MKQILTTIVTLILALNATPTHAVPYLPPSVAPGSTYHLVFVTSTTRDGASTNIADYNTFVNNAAANNPVLTGTNVGVNYFAIASTATINANANAAVSDPVYNFNGDKVADNFADMWDGTLDAPILYDEFVNIGFPDIWTGSQLNGNAFVGFEMGNSIPRTGLGNFNTDRWISDAVGPQQINMSLYALSQQLTAPDSTVSVPEPVTATLLLAGTLAMTRRRRVA